MLKEEIRVTTQQVSQRQPQSVTVRREEAVVERIKVTNEEEK
jgi:hypothetical protein